MMNYRGDMNPKVLVTTATIVDGAEAVMLTCVEGNTGMIVKPMLIVKSSTVDTFTGSLVITYTGRLNGLPLCSTNISYTANVLMEESDNASWGICIIDDFDFSIIKITGVESDLGVNIDDLTIYLSGLLNN